MVRYFMDRIVLWRRIMKIDKHNIQWRISEYNNVNLHYKNVIRRKSTARNALRKKNAACSLTLMVDHIKRRFNVIIWDKLLKVIENNGVPTNIHAVMQLQLLYNLFCTKLFFSSTYTFFLRCNDFTILENFNVT